MAGALAAQEHGLQSNFNAARGRHGEPPDRLREEAGVIVLPGSGFGAGGEGFFRISFIQSPERIAEAARRAGDTLRRMMADQVARDAALDVVPAGAGGT